MATIAKELHNGLVTVLDMLNTMVAALQRIDAEQQDCIYKLEVMAGIQLADAKPPPTPLPSLLPTLLLAPTNLVQSPLEMMDAMPTLHPDLQRIGDEQQPMSIDGLPALHPDLQQIIDKQQATSTSAPQPVVQSALLLPPAPPFSASTGLHPDRRSCLLLPLPALQPSVGLRICRRHPLHCLHPGFVTNTRVCSCHKLVQTRPVCLGPGCGGTYADGALTTKKGCCPYTATMKCATSSRDVKGLVSSHLFSLVRRLVVVMFTTARGRAAQKEG
jgi:hypothetical protein